MHVDYFKNSQNRLPEFKEAVRLFYKEGDVLENLKEKLNEIRGLELDKLKEEFPLEDGLLKAPRHDSKEKEERLLWYRLYSKELEEITKSITQLGSLVRSEFDKIDNSDEEQLDLSAKYNVERQVEFIMHITKEKNKQDIIDTVTSLIKEAGKNLSKRDVLTSILPILKEVPDDDVGKQVIYNDLLTKSYPEKAIISIFGNESLGKRNITKDRWVGAYPSSLKKDKILEYDTHTRYAKEAGKEIISTVVDIPIGIIEGVTRGFGSVVSDTIFHASGKKLNLGYGNAGKRPDYRPHAWTRLIRNQFFEDYDLERGYSIASYIPRVIGGIAGVLCGLVVAIPVGIATFATSQVGDLISWNQKDDKKKDDDYRMELIRYKEARDVETKKGRDKGEFSFSEQLIRGIKDKQQQEDVKKLIDSKGEEKQCYYGIGLKLNLNQKGYIEVESIFRDFKDRKDIKQGDKITKISDGDKTVDIVNLLSTGNDNDMIMEKVAEILLKSQKNKVDLTKLDGSTVSLDKKVFVRNTTDRLSSGGVKREFLSVEKANDKDVVNAIKQIRPSERDKQPESSLTAEDLRCNMKEFLKKTKQQYSASRPAEDGGTENSGVPSDRPAFVATTENLNRPQTSTSINSTEAQGVRGGSSCCPS
jgi:hypothetical protein